MTQRVSENTPSDKKPPVFIEDIKLPPLNEKTDCLEIEVVIKHQSECKFEGKPELLFDLSESKFGFKAEGATIVQSGESKAKGGFLIIEVAKRQTSNPSDKVFEFIVNLPKLLTSPEKSLELNEDREIDESPYRPVYGNRQGKTNIEYDLAFPDYEQDYSYSDDWGQFHQIDGILQFVDGEAKSSIDFYINNCDGKCIRIKKMHFHSWQWWMYSLFFGAFSVNFGPFSTKKINKYQKYAILSLLSFAATYFLKPHEIGVIESLLIDFGLLSPGNSIELFSWPLVLFFLFIFYKAFALLLYVLEEKYVQSKVFKWLKETYPKHLQTKRLEKNDTTTARIPFRMLAWVGESNTPLEKSKRNSQGGSPTAQELVKELMLFMNSFMGVEQGELPNFLLIELQELATNGLFKVIIKDASPPRDNNNPSKITVSWEHAFQNLPQRFQSVEFRDLNFNKPADNLLSDFNYVQDENNGNEYYVYEDSARKLDFRIDSCKFDGKELGKIVYEQQKQQPQPEIQNNNNLADIEVVQGNSSDLGKTADVTSLNNNHLDTNTNTGLTPPEPAQEDSSNLRKAAVAQQTGQGPLSINQELPSRSQ